MDFIKAEELESSFQVMKACIIALKNNLKYKVNCVYEPQLGKRGLYPDISIKNSSIHVRDMMNFLVYTDGINDLIEISDKINVPVSDQINMAEKLIGANLISSCNK